MDDLLYVTPPFRADAYEGYCDDHQDHWTDACDTAAAFRDHRREWAYVMAELMTVQFPVREHDADSHRPATLLDRRGRWLTSIHAPPRDNDC